MAMEITNNYSTYENIYATQKQQTEKKQAASGKETSETVDAQKNSKVGNDKTKSTADYAKKLEKLVPSVEFRVGNPAERIFNLCPGPQDEACPAFFHYVYRIGPHGDLRPFAQGEFPSSG